MGCDGGTIPTRDELVKTKKKPEQKDKTAELVAKWKHCAISQESLHLPIMACQLGRLYNKESALELLIDRSNFECASSFEHLRSLKDLTELGLTENPSTAGRPKAEKGDSYIDVQASEYICPVVGVEMNGRYRFCYIWSCGCVLSERAFREFKTDNCPKCEKPYLKEDVIILNGTEEDVDQLRNRMDQKILQAKLDKKTKKAEKHKAEAMTSSETADGPSASKSVRFVEQPGSSKSASGAASHISKLTNGKPHSKSKLPIGKPGKVEEKPSIQKDTTTSTVYKSLFTSSETAKNRATAHWVTYNPCYY